jgi:hypothetical protein
MAALVVGELAEHPGLDGTAPATGRHRGAVAGAEADLGAGLLDDFDQYWSFHLSQERRRVHASRYALGVIPQPA